MEANREMSDEEIGKELIKILDKWFGGTVSTDMHFDYSPEAEVVNFLKPIYIKVGIKEVVEFVEQEGVMYRCSDTLARWRAKIEEWGVDET